MQTTVQNVEDLPFLETSTWSQSGDQIIGVTNGIEQVMTIVELTATTLKLSASVTEDISQQGATIITTVDLITTYTR